jgi:glycosyltransferase involved in cell wall biosynthesis
VDSFAAQLALVLDDPALRARLADNALVFAEACSWENVARHYEAVFSELIGHSAGTANRSERAN